MANSPDHPAAFNAMMYFIISPDRYYRIELQSQQSKLYFLKTGSQFDLEHPCSVGRFKMSEASNQPSPPRRKLLLIVAGSVITIISLALLFIAARLGWVVMPLAVLAAFGIVLVMAGIVASSRPYVTNVANTDDALAAHPHNFAVALSEILTAAFTLPKRPGSAASLHFTLASGKSLKLLIKSPSDLEIASTMLSRLLGPRLSIMQTRRP